MYADPEKESRDLPGSDPIDPDPGSVWIIDPTFTVCRQIHRDHRSTFIMGGGGRISREISTRVRVLVSCIVFGSTGIRAPAV